MQTQQQQQHHTDEDWFDDAFVASWIAQQEANSAGRQRHFAMVRAHIPFPPDASFKYLNLGAGWGPLDQVLLASFPRARATLLDGSPLMLAQARERLERFGDRMTYVQADLTQPGWSEAVRGPHDVVVSTAALHNLFDAAKIRTLYAEIYEVMGDDTLFVNLDHVRLASPQLAPLARWARRDPDAGIAGSRGGPHLPGTMEEQLGWLREAGFTAVDCFWKEYGIALYGGWRGHVRVPETA